MTCMHILYIIWWLWIFLICELLILPPLLLFAVRCVFEAPYHGMSKALVWFGAVTLMYEVSGF